MSSPNTDDESHWVRSGQILTKEEIKKCADQLHELEQLINRGRQTSNMIKDRANEIKERVTRSKKGLYPPIPMAELGEIKEELNQLEREADLNIQKERQFWDQVQVILRVLYHGLT